MKKIPPFGLQSVWKPMITLFYEHISKMKNWGQNSKKIRQALLRKRNVLSVNIGPEINECNKKIV